MKKQIFPLLISLGFLCSFFVVEAAGELQPVQPGRGYLFDGVDDYVDLGSDILIDTGKAFSIDFSLQEITQPANNGIFTLQGTDGYILGAFVNPGATYTPLGFTIYKDASHNFHYKPEGTISRNIWQNLSEVSIIYDGNGLENASSFTFILDGEEIAAVVSGSVVASTNSINSLGLGAAVYTGNYGSIVLGNFRIYDEDNKLLHSWHMDEGTGEIMYDSVREWKIDVSTRDNTWALDTNVSLNNGTITFTSNGTDSNMWAMKTDMLELGEKVKITFRTISFVGSGYLAFQYMTPSAGEISVDDDGISLKEVGWHAITVNYLNSGSGTKRLQPALKGSIDGTILEIDNIKTEVVHSPSHGTITNATPATFHTTDTDFKSYQNDYGYSENVPSDVELITNGVFDTDSDWTTGTNWSISDGRAIATGSVYSLIPSVSVPLEAGKTYNLELDLQRTSGGLYYRNGGAFASLGIDSEHKSRTFTASSTENFYFGASTFTGSIDNVSLREIPNAKIPLATTETGRILKEDIFGNDATYTGRTRTEAELVGKNVANFDGVDDYVLIGAVPIDINDSFTISFKMKVPELKSDMRIFGAKDVVDLHKFWGIRLSSSTLWIWDGSSWRVLATGITELDTWYDIVVIVDKELSASCYVNGVLVNSNISMTGSLAHMNYDSMAIGSAYSSAGIDYAGKLGDFRIYDYALSETEVSNLYNENNQNTGLIIHYPLSEGAGTTVYDTVPARDVQFEKTNFTLVDSSLSEIDDYYRITRTSATTHLFIPHTIVNGKSYKVSFEIRSPVGYLTGGLFNARISAGGDSASPFAAIPSFGYINNGGWHRFEATVQATDDAPGFNLYDSASLGVDEFYDIKNIIVEEEVGPINGTVTNADLDTFWATDMDAEDQNLVNGYTPVALLNGTDDRTLITNGTTLGGERLVAKLKTTGTARQAVFSGAFDTTEIVHFDTSGKFGSGGANVTGVATTESFNDGEWHIFDITKNATNDYTILVDGEDYSGGASSGYRVTNAVGLAYSSPLLPFNGEIQYITVYDNGGSKLIDLQSVGDGKFRDSVSGDFYTSDGDGYKDVSLPAQYGSTGLDINESRLIRSPQDLRNSAMAYKNVGVFDGVDDYMTLSTDIVNNLKEVATVSFWVKPGSYKGSYTGWMDGRNASSKRFAMWRQDEDSVYFAVNGTQKTFTIPQSELEDTWHHYTMVVTGTDVKGYWDGVYKNSFSLSSDISEITSLRWGNWGGGNFDNSSFSDVRIYKKALSAAEVEKIYQGESISTNGLVAHYPLSEGAGTTAYNTAAELLSAEQSVNTGTIGTTDWIDDDSDGTPNGVSGYSSTLNFSIGTGNGFDGNYLIATNVSGNRFQTSPTIDAGVWADVSVLASGSGTLKVYNTHTSTYETIGTLTPSVQTFTHRIKTYGAGAVIFSITDTVNIDNISIKEVFFPSPGTLTNTTPADFWQIDDTAPFSQSYREGFSQGLVNTTAGTVYTPSDVAYGEWEFDLYKGGESNYTRVYFIRTDKDSATGSYAVVLDSSERFMIHKNGSVTDMGYSAASYITNNTWYRIKITRSPVGLFSIYIKGGDFGDDYVLVDVTGGLGSNPVTNNTYTTSSYFVADLDPGDKIANVQIDGHRATIHEFVEGTGSYDKLFIPAQTNKGMDVLGSILQISGTKTASIFTAADLVFIAAQKLAREGINYWDATTKKFFTGRADGSLVDFIPNTERAKTTVELATMNTNQAAEAEHNYWDTTLRKFLRGLSDGSLVDFLTWYATQ